MTITTMARDKMIPWPNLNPRQQFPDEGLEELRATLLHDGMLQPIGVKLNESGPHWIWAGERRWRASAGVLDTLPVIVRDIDEKTALRLAITENLQRSDLTAMEEARGIQRYLEATAGELKQMELADELGRSQAWVSNRLRLLRLSPQVQEQLAEGIISATQARDLILPFSGLPEQLWKEFSKGLDRQLAKLREPIEDLELRRRASKVAFAMSGFLDRRLWDVAIDKEVAYDIAIPKARWKTAPAGSIIEYDYVREYNSSLEGRSSRAFDTQWWSAEILRAEEAARKLREKNRTAAEAAKAGREVTHADIPWVPAQQGTTIPGDFELINSNVVYEPLPDGDFDIWVDPSVLHPDTLVLREGTVKDMMDEGLPRQPMVVCTDGEAWELAAQSWSKRVRGVRQLRRREGMKRERANMAPLDYATVLPELLVLTDQHLFRSRVQEGAPSPSPDLLQQCTWDERQSLIRKEMLEFFRSNIEEVRLLVDVYLNRMRSDPETVFSIDKQLEEEAFDEFRLEAARALRERISFDLPGWDPQFARAEEVEDEEEVDDGNV